MDKKKLGLIADALTRKPSGSLLSLKPKGGFSGLLQGPYAPMGGGVNIGAPIDMNRQKLSNDDGSFSTERTVTIPLNGRWYNVPTIVDGVQYPEGDIEYYFSQGWIPHVGEFPTVETAVRSARVRTDAIGKKRQ